MKNSNDGIGNRTREHVRVFLRNLMLDLFLNLGLVSNLIHKIIIYLHIIHLLKSSTCFEHCPVHLQEVYVVIVYMQPLVSSLSVKSELSKITATQ